MERNAKYCRYSSVKTEENTAGQNVEEEKRRRQRFCTPAEHRPDQFRSTLMILGGKRGREDNGGRGKRGTGLPWKLLSEAHSWSPWKPAY